MDMGVAAVGDIDVTAASNHDIRWMIEG